MIELVSASSSAKEVSMSTWVSGCDDRISRHASMPERAGRRTSMTTTSGWRLSTTRRAESASPASPTTSWPGTSSSRLRSPRRTSSWSSQSTTRMGRTEAAGASAFMRVMLISRHAPEKCRWSPPGGPKVTGRAQPRDQSPANHRRPALVVKRTARDDLAVIGCTERSDMSTASTVIDHTGVRIGTVDASGAVLDHNGVRIGSVDAQGTVLDHNGVRIGRRG